MGGEVWCAVCGRKLYGKRSRVLQLAQASVSSATGAVGWGGWEHLKGAMASQPGLRLNIVGGDTVTGAGFGRSSGASSIRGEA